MKKNRHDCQQCQNFIEPVFSENDENLFLSKIISMAKCKLGKRVMFRTNGHNSMLNHHFESGWFRYCGEFEKK